MNTLRILLITSFIAFMLFFMLGIYVTGDFHHGVNWGKNGLLLFGLFGGIFVVIPFLGKKLGDTIKG